MKLVLPNRAYLADIERFLNGRQEDGELGLSFDLSNGFFSVHPMVLCMISATAAEARQNGHYVQLINDRSTSSIRYLERMKLFDLMGVESVSAVKEHEPAGRFIPLTQISDGKELSKFLTDVVPLLHAQPEEAMTVRYVLAELVRNTLEHSGPPHVAYVAAQVTKTDGRLLVGVADNGIGIRSSITRYHSAPTDKEAIVKAFEPGVSGATARFGGNENNGGAGLFFMKAMATMARCHMAAISGNSLLKLYKQPVGKLQVKPSLTKDRARFRELDIPFKGTAIGIDIQISDDIKFSDLLRQIRGVYNLRISEGNVVKRKARFR